MSELRAYVKRLAARGHINQTYNDGSYFEFHLERVGLAAHAIACEEKINDEETLDVIYCASFLHDYLEDCFDYSVTSLEKEHKTLSEQTSIAIANVVLILSKNFYKSEDDYYSAIAENMITKIVKTADRLSNILSLPEVKITKKRIKLLNKYKSQQNYFTRYNIYPEYIQRALNETERILFNSGK